MQWVTETAMFFQSSNIWDVRLEKKGRGLTRILPSRSSSLSYDSTNILASSRSAKVIAAVLPEVGSSVLAGLLSCIAFTCNATSRAIGQRQRVVSRSILLSGPIHAAQQASVAREGVKMGG